MGRQTSQYSLCISVCDAVYFLYGQCDFSYGQLLTFYIVNSSFDMVNFLLLKRSVFTFYMVKSTFYMVKLLLFIWSSRLFKWSNSLFIWSSRLFIWSNFYFLYDQVDFFYGQIHFLYGQIDFLYM